MSGPSSSLSAIVPTTAAAATTAAPPIFTTAPATTTAAVIATTAPLTMPQDASPTEAFNALTAAIYGMQRQMGELSLRLVAVEGRPSSSASSFLPYGLPGYGGIPALPGTGPVITDVSDVFSAAPFQQTLPAATAAVTTTTAVPPFQPPPPPSTGVPITQISFPHSPSPVPSFSDIMQGSYAPPPPSAAMHMPPPLPHLPPEPAS